MSGKNQIIKNEPNCEKMEIYTYKLSALKKKLEQTPVEKHFRGNMIPNLVRTGQMVYIM